MSDVGTVGEWVSVARDSESGVDNCIPHFYYRTVESKKKSEEAGRPIFDETAYVEIFTPGDKLSRPNCKVTDEHRSRWPDAWAKFERSHQETYGEGTPLEEWPPLTRRQVMEYKALGVFTVEALAGLDDQGLQNIGAGGREIKQRAQAFLDLESEKQTKLKAEIELRDGVEAELRAQNAELLARLEALEAKSPEPECEPGDWTSLGEHQKMDLAQQLGCDKRIKDPEKIRAYLEDNA